MANNFTKSLIKLGTGSVFLPVDKTSCRTGSERPKNESTAVQNGRSKMKISDRWAEVQKVAKIDSFEAVSAIFWQISRTSARVRPSARTQRQNGQVSFCASFLREKRHVRSDKYHFARHFCAKTSRQIGQISFCASFLTPTLNSRTSHRKNNSADLSPI